MKKYLLSEEDRRELVAALHKQRTDPPPRNIARTINYSSQEGDTYWVIPPCEQGLPAADMVGGVPVPIAVQACLYRHSWRNAELEAMVGPTGLPLRVPVYNYFDRAENNLTQVYKQKDGTWTNARPDDYDVKAKNEAAVTTVTGTTRLIQGGTSDPNCAGECKWEADANGVWQGPTGGCTNGSTTTTTTAAATTTTTTSGGGGGGGGTGGGYSTALPNSPTLAPCYASRCRLICGAATGTTGTGTTSGPVRLVYSLATGTTACPTGCECYGLGDPCFLDGGELLSHCIGPAPTQAPTTTLNPGAPACDLAAALFGTAEDFIYRAAVHGGVAEAWTVCEPCADGTVPLFPLGGEEFRYSGRPDLVTVYESLCVEPPCSIEVQPQVAGRSVFLAYSYEKQLFRWPGAGRFIDRDGTKFRANWFNCTPCTGRPEAPPPYWIHDSEDLNLAAGVRYDEGAGVYVFEVACKEGIDCASCGRAPYVFPTTTTTSPSASTTTGTTGTGTTSSAAPTTTTAPTTPLPCSCERPTRCGDPYECIWTRCSPGGTTATRNPNLACFNDSTTPYPYTPPVGSTIPPTHCVDWRGVLCDCRSAPTTLPATGGTCPPGYSLIYPPEPCSAPYCLPGATNQPPTTAAPPPCAGYCFWVSRVRSFGPPAVYTWILQTSACSALPNCACEAPNDIPGSCNIETVTGCVSKPSASTRPPCGCCTDGTAATTPGPACVTGRCRYSGNGSNGWTKTIDTCPTGTQCPCASAGSIGRPSSDTCDSFTLACGQDPPTTTATGTGTTIRPDGYGCCVETCLNGSWLWRCQPVNTPEECTALGGAQSPYNSNCIDPNGVSSCEQLNETGVCCRPGGSCSAQDAASCILLGGKWRAGGVCDARTNPCPHADCEPTTSSTTTTSTIPPSLTRCCRPYCSGPHWFNACEPVVNSAECISLGGRPVADCTASPIQCNTFLASGVCCRYGTWGGSGAPTWRCSTEVYDDCLIGGGIWRAPGQGNPCSGAGNPCPHPSCSTGTTGTGTTAAATTTPAATTTTEATTTAAATTTPEATTTAAATTTPAATTTAAATTTPAATTTSEPPPPTTPEATTTAAATTTPAATTTTLVTTTSEPE